MKIVTKNIEFDLLNSNFLTNEVIQLLKTSSKIYLIPQTLYGYLKSKVESDSTLNTTIYWTSCLDLYSSILQGINSSKHLQGINYGYDVILNEWRNNNILNSYRGSYDAENGKTFTYTFTDTNAYTFVFLLDDKKIANTIDVDLDDFYKDTLLNCDIDVERAIYDEYINKTSISKFVKRISLIFNFLGTRYIKKGDKVNRWYNSFCSLTSISRKYVKLNGNYFYEMDLSNAQPSLLCKYLIDNYGDDFDTNYIEKTSNGEFYESIMNAAVEMGIEGEKTWDKELGCKTWKSLSNRSDVKKLCYQNIFFAQNTSSKTFSIFNKLYSNTWRLLNYELNMGDDKLASILQNMEASIFLNIKPKCNYFTVHDAIYIIDKSFKSFIDNKVKELMGTDKFVLVSDFEEQDLNRINYNVTIEGEGNTTLFIIEDSNRKPHKEHKNSNKEQIKQLKQSGWSKDKIIEHLKISRKTYYKWIREDEDEKE
jgi:hypothetical protein